MSPSQKNKKVSRARWLTPIIPALWAWWRAPVVPANRDAEAGELLEPRRWRLQWAKILPLYSSLGNRVRLCLKKKKMVIVQMQLVLESSPITVSGVTLGKRLALSSQKKKKEYMEK